MAKTIKTDYSRNLARREAPLKYSKLSSGEALRSLVNKQECNELS